MIKRLGPFIVCLIFLLFSGLSFSQPVVSNLGWMVGQNGTIIRWNGNTWNIIPSSASVNLYGVHFYRTYYGIAVGDSGKIIRWDGNKWENVSSPTSNNLYDAYLFSASDGWAVGASGTILEWNGASWDNSHSDAAFGNLRSVDFVNSNTGWAVGDGGSIVRSNGTSWSSFSSPTSNDLYSVDMISSSFGVIVGQAGKILHWNGSSWNEVTSPVTDNLRSVYMISGNDGWAVGDSGTIINWNGKGWSEYTHSLTTNTLRTVSFNDSVSYDGWIGSDGGVILRYDGQNWSKLASSPTSNNLLASFIMTDDIDPHVDNRYEADTDMCASCHRAHTSTGTHLTIPVSPIEQCFTCHDGTISFYDAQIDYNSTYHHSLQGIDDGSTKNCSSCHESHRQNIWTEEYLVDPLDAKNIWEVVDTTSPSYNNASSPSGLYIWCERCHTDSSITGNYFEETMSATYKPYTVQVIWQTSRSATSTPPGVDESGTTSGFWQYFRANIYNDTGATGDKHGRASGISGTVNYYNGYSNSYPALPCTDCHNKHGSDQPWMIDTAFDLSTLSGQQNYCTSICHDLGSHPAPNPPTAKCTDCHRHGLRF